MRSGEISGVLFVVSVSMLLGTTALPRSAPIRDLRCHTPVAPLETAVYFGGARRIRQTTNPASSKTRATAPATTNTCGRPNGTPSPPEPAEGILAVAIVAKEKPRERAPLVAVISRVANFPSLNPFLRFLRLTPHLFPCYALVTLGCAIRREAVGDSGLSLR